MNKRLLITALLCLVMLSGSLAPSDATAQITVAATPATDVFLTLPNSDGSSTVAGKFPSLASVGNTVEIVSNPDKVVQVWSKSDSANTVGAPTKVGFNSNSTTYENAAIAAGPDGAMYTVWIDRGSGIRLKRKAAGGGWPNAAVNVYNSSAFLNGVDVAVASDDRVFVIWKEAEFLYYRVSTPGGGSWGSVSLLSTRKDYGLAPQIASGPDGSVAAAFGTDHFHIYALIWNGAGFNQVDITPDGGGGNAYADPGVAIGPDGRVYVGYRYIREDSQGNKIARIYYSERKTDGTWGTSKLFEGGTNVRGTVGVAADKDNNVHVTWVNDKAGSWDLYYAVRDGNEVWSSTGRVSGVGASLLADPGVTGTTGGLLYGHVAVEYFYAKNEQVRYARFSTATGPVGPRASPVLADGNPTINQDPMSVKFIDVQNSPTQLRWKWNGAPTDASNDSNGWQSFANPKSIGLPSGLDKSVCQNLTLYTQVKNDAATQFDTSSDGVLFDGAVQANIHVANPFMAGLPKTLTLGPRLADTYNKPSDGAYDGDEGYTRMPQYFLGIYTNADCSGLSSYNVAVSNASGTISNGLYENRLSLAQNSIPNPGAKTNVTVAVTDKLGNLLAKQYELVYDPADTDPSPTVTNTLGLPTLNGGNVSVDTANSIIRTLTFSNVSVDDTTYGDFENLPDGRQFWGVWIANSRTPVGDPNNSNLQWFPIQVGNPGASFNVSWNLFNGLASGDRTTGTYYIYVKFLDGAGNATIGTLSAAQAQLSAGFSMPKLYLPQVAKAN